MIRATKAEVDEAKKELTLAFDNAAYEMSRWQANLTDPARARDALAAVDQAGNAFDEHERMLKAWAAGPTEPAFAFPTGPARKKTVGEAIMALVPGAEGAGVKP